MHLAGEKISALDSGADRGGARIALRCSQAWRDWLQGLADHRRQSIAQTATRALERYAEDVGYHRPSPRRTPDRHDR